MTYIVDPGFKFTPFRELRVVNRKSLISAYNMFGTSSLRFSSSLGASGTITNNGSEFKLSTGDLSGGFAKLSTKKRANYSPGFSSEIGMGVRLSGTFIGDSYAAWGFFDTDNGFGFGSDISGNYVFIRKNTLDSKYYQDNWNIDTIPNLTMSNGHVFSIQYTWYGYGSIEFGINTSLTTGSFKKYTPLHIINVSGATTINNPNLPINSEVKNNSTTASINLFLGGMSATSIGDKKISARTAAHLVSGSVVGSAAFTPLISIKKKPTLNSFVNFINSYISSIELLTDQSIIYKITINPTLTSSSFVNPPSWNSDEISSLIDSSATAVTGGLDLEIGLLYSNSTKNNLVSNKEEHFGEFVFGVDDTITLSAKAINTPANVISIMKWTEEW